MRFDLYQHYRGGLYLVLGEADVHDDVSLPEQSFVVYYSLERKTLHVRLRDEFHGKVDHLGQETLRFKAIRKMMSA